MLLRLCVWPYRRLLLLLDCVLHRSSALLLFGYSILYMCIYTKEKGPGQRKRQVYSSRLGGPERFNQPARRFEHLARYMAKTLCVSRPSAIL
jgi:hypothetical protein